jgi:hypothetical protein
MQYAVVVLPFLARAAIGADRVCRHGPGDALDVLSLTSIGLHNVAYAMILPMGRFSVEVYPHVAWLAAGGALVLVAAMRTGSQLRSKT